MVKIDQQRHIKSFMVLSLPSTGNHKEKSKVGKQNNGFLLFFFKKYFNIHLTKANMKT